MKTKMFNRAQVIKQLQDEIALYGSQKVWAAKHRISTSYLHDVLKRGKPIGEKIARALGYRRVEGFEIQP